MSSRTFSLRDVITGRGESWVRFFLSTFVCTKDCEAEGFLKEDAIEFEKDGISRTYLVLEKNDSGKDVIKGYFTLAIKCFKINTKQDRKQDRKIPLSLENQLNVCNGIAQAYLLGQLAKADDAEDGLGKKMMDHALEIFKRSHETVGCRVVRLDCKDALIDYYKKHGFTHMGKLDQELNLMVMIL